MLFIVVAVVIVYGLGDDVIVVVPDFGVYLIHE